jgi:hypothetical protein
MNTRETNRKIPVSCECFSKVLTELGFSIHSVKSKNIKFPVFLASNGIESKLFFGSDGITTVITE